MFHVLYADVVVIVLVVTVVTWKISISYVLCSSLLLPTLNLKLHFTQDLYTLELCCCHNNASVAHTFTLKDKKNKNQEKDLKEKRRKKDQMLLKIAGVLS